MPLGSECGHSLRRGGHTLGCLPHSSGWPCFTHLLAPGFPQTPPPCVLHPHLKGSFLVLQIPRSRRSGVPPIWRRHDKLCLRTSLGFCFRLPLAEAEMRHHASAHRENTTASLPTALKRVTSQDTLDPVVQRVGSTGCCDVFCGDI